MKTSAMARTRTTNAEALFSLLTLLVALALLGGCKRQLPSPWKESQFPLSNAELMPGADERGFQANYPTGTPLEDLFREYQRSLEGKGWSVLTNGTSHDPQNGAFSVIMKREHERVLVTISGGKPVQARVTTSVD